MSSRSEIGCCEVCSYVGFADRDDSDAAAAEKAVNLVRAEFASLAATVIDDKALRDRLEVAIADTLTRTAAKLAIEIASARAAAAARLAKYCPAPSPDALPAEQASPGATRQKRYRQRKALRA
jgi:hypothetical protein